VSLGSDLNMKMSENPGFQTHLTLKLIACIRKSVVDTQAFILFVRYCLRYDPISPFRLTEPRSSPSSSLQLLLLTTLRIGITFQNVRIFFCVIPGSWQSFRRLMVWLHWILFSFFQLRVGGGSHVETASGSPWLKECHRNSLSRLGRICNQLSALTGNISWWLRHT